MKRIYLPALLVINLLSIVHHIQWGYRTHNTSMLVIYMPSLYDLAVSIIASLIAILLVLLVVYKDAQTRVLSSDDLLDAPAVQQVNRERQLRIWAGILTVFACFYMFFRVAM